KLTFLAEQTGSVLAYYPEIDWGFSFSGLPPGSSIPDLSAPGQGLDDKYRETLPAGPSIPGGDYLRLYRPGEWNPLEAAGFYQTAADIEPGESRRSSLYLVRRDNPEDQSHPLAFETPDSRTLFLGTGGAVPGEALYSFPLITTLPSLYGPGALKDPELQDHQLRLALLSPLGEYRLEKPLAGSVRVRINGAPVSGFSVSPAGILTLPYVILSTDLIEVRYRSASSSRSGGDFLLGLGNRFFLGPYALEIGAGLKWNLFSASYTERQEQNPGALLLSGSLIRREGDWNFHLDGGFSLSTGDTTGRFRIQGMESAGLPVILFGGGIYPAARPDGLDAAAKRGRLFYKDYHSYTPLGGAVLNDYSWNPPADQVFDYPGGGRIGPYLTAAKADGREGQILTLDFHLAHQEWAGAQIPLGSGGRPPDLSSARALNFSWKWDGGPPGNVKVVVEMGRLGEDLDGDGLLDEEYDALSGGFEFNVTEGSYAGAVLNYGAGREGRGDGYRHSEDTDGNGILDPSLPAQRLSFSFSPGDQNYPDSQWKYLTLNLSGGERLAGVSAIRVYLVNKEGTPLQGRLLVGDFFFEGSSFLIREGPPQGDTLTVSETYEGQLPPGERPQRSLESAWPEVLRVFHPSGESQKILRVERSSTTTPSGRIFTIENYTAPAALGDYGELVFYLRTPELGDPAARLSLSYRDAAGRGLRGEFTPGVLAEWARITLDLRTREIKLDGRPLIGAILAIDSGVTAAAVLSLSLDSPSGGGGGRDLIFMDEFHLAESLLKSAGALEGGFDYRREGPLLSLGGRTLVGDLSLRAGGSYAQSGFAQGLAQGRTEASGLGEGGTLGDQGGGQTQATGALSLGAAILKGRFDLSGHLRGTSGGEDLSTAFSHRFTLPFLEGRIRFGDSYSEGDAGGAKNFSRSSRLEVFPARGLNLSISNGVSVSSRLTQSWNLRLDWGLPGALRFQLASGLSQTAAAQPEEALYPAQWAGSFAFLRPREKAETRTGFLNMETGGTRGPLGFTLNLRGNWERRPWTASSGLSWEDSSGIPRPEDYLRSHFFLSLGGQFAGETEERRNFHFEPGYSRSLTWIHPGGASPWYSDAGDYLRTLGERSFALTAPPFYEIYAPAFFTRFRADLEGQPGDGEYRPGYALTLRRSSGSYLLDFFLPSQLGFEQERRLARWGSVWSDVLAARLSLRFSWINLFGRLGVLPLLGGLYDSDEASTALTYLREKDRLRAVEEKHSLILQSYVFIQPRRDSVLSLDNYLSFNFLGDQNWKENAKITWSRPGNPAFFRTWPVIRNHPDWIAGAGNTEILEISAGSEKTVQTLSFSFTHRIDLRLAPGTLGLFAGLGMARRDAPNFPVYLFGLKGGISGDFAF
ncbi:MAG: hypothetical protein LBQ61_00095, partial [Spirochaetales bacterium]|nr:hypothetical protein [Spirochaetales bacterium]